MIIEYAFKMSNAMCYNSAMPTWKEAVALIIVIGTALFWIIVGAVRFLSNTGMMGGLVEGALIGVVLLVSCFAALRWRRTGGWLLVFEGMIPIAMFIVRGDIDVMRMIAVSGPAIVSGLLFVIE